MSGSNYTLPIKKNCLCKVLNNARGMFYFFSQMAEPAITMT